MMDSTTIQQNRLYEDLADLITFSWWGSRGNRAGIWMG